MKPILTGCCADAGTASAASSAIPQTTFLAFISCSRMLDEVLALDRESDRPGMWQPHGLAVRQFVLAKHRSYRKRSSDTACRRSHCWPGSAFDRVLDRLPSRRLSSPEGCPVLDNSKSAFDPRRTSGLPFLSCAPTMRARPEPWGALMRRREFLGALGNALALPTTVARSIIVRAKQPSTAVGERLLALRGVK